MNDEKAILERLERLAAAPRAAGAAGRRAEPDFDAAEAFVWQADAGGFLPVRTSTAAARPAQGHRPRRPTAARQHAPLRPGPARQQRAALGRARHGQVVARQGGACRGAPRAGARRRARPISSSSRSTARTSPRCPRCLAPPARSRAPLHRVLRRPLLRQGRHLLQVAQGGAGRRHRGPARERPVLRHLQPPPPDAARHDGERALDRHQPVRGGRGEGVAVGPLRPLARLPQLPPRTSTSTWCAAMPRHHKLEIERRRARARGARVVA